MNWKLRAHRALNRILAKAGYELVNRREQPPAMTPDEQRPTKAGALQQLARAGLQPATVIDVGAATGTPELYRAFPDAHHVLIEPLSEFEPFLRQWQQQIAGLQYHLVAATATDNPLTIRVYPGLFGSSAYAQTLVEASEARTIPGMTLDTLCAQAGLGGPYVLKIDTQGAELDVLKGAQTLLSQVMYILLEVRLIDNYAGVPLIAELIAEMARHQFVLYDILEPLYRPLDGALNEADFAFVPVDSPLRADKRFGTDEQVRNLLAKMTRQFNRDLEALG